MQCLPNGGTSNNILFPLLPVGISSGQQEQNQPQTIQSMLYPLAVCQTNPSMTSFLPHFSWLLHQLVGY
jgi:hypothetical protein